MTPTEKLRAEVKDLGFQLEASEGRNQLLDQRNAELVIRVDDMTQIAKRRDQHIRKLEILLKEYL